MKYDDKILVYELSDIPDSQGWITPSHSIVKYPKQVLLINRFSRELKDMIGIASMYREGNCFYITNFVITNREYLGILEELTPAIGGFCIKKDSNIVEEFTIDVVSLSCDRNSNNNIKSIKEQLKNQRTEEKS